MQKVLLVLILLLGLAVGLYADYTVNFEGTGEVKTGYASGNVSLSSLNWNLTEALIGTDAADWKNGIRSNRMRGYGTSALSMVEDKTGGLGTISFLYRRYGTDAQVDWKVEYSTDGGTSWLQAGDVFTAPATNDVQTFTATVNALGSARIRIVRATASGTSNRRLNIDDIVLTDYTGGGANLPPQISNIIINPASNITPSTTVAVSANISDSDGTIGSAQVKWGTTTGTYPNTINMSLTSGTTYTTVSNIPAQVDGTTVYFILSATDDDSAVTNSSEQTYNVVAPTPTLTITGTLSAFSTTLGTPSASQNYNLSGINLTAGISVSAPEGFELSTDNSVFSASLNLVQSFNAPVYVRLSGAIAGSYSGNINHDSSGAAQQTLAATGTVHAPVVPALLLEENFVYTPATLLTANGWTNHSGTSNFIPVSNTNLSYPGYPTNGGYSAQLLATGEDVNRAFATQYTGSVYAAFLVNVSDAKETGDYFLHLGQETLGSNFRPKVFINKETGTNNFRFGITKGANYSAGIAATGYNYSYGNTYLLVVKYEILAGATNDQVYLFVNPDFSGAEPTPTLTALDPTATDLSDVGRIALRQGTSTSGPSLLVDGIRVANDWDEMWDYVVLNPVINVVGEFEPFIAIQGEPSERQFYSLSGTDLYSTIEIAAPANFELSATGNEPWTASLSLPSTYTGDIFVRMNAETAGSYSGNISHNSSGATEVLFFVEGEVLSPEGVINVVQNLQAFNGEMGTPTAAQSYTLSGTDLYADIFVNVSAPFEISLNGTSNWQSDLILPFSFNGSIFVRMNATSFGTFNGTITHISDGAQSVEIQISGTASTTGPASDLFFSEYIEGSSNNKAIEIFNGTGVAVDLSDYRVELYGNGSATMGNNITLSGTLPHGEVYVIANDAANATILGLADITSTVTYYNGDDALGLRKLSTNTLVDIFGVIGNDPGTEWTADGGYSTLNKTLVRKPNIVSGVSENPTGTGPTAFVTLASEWDVHPIDTTTFLGSHDFNPGGQIAATPTFNPPAGAYMSPIQVAISSATAGATIYFTTDSTTPSSTNGTLYSTPISINATTTLKAIAYADGYDASTVATATYSYPVPVANIAALRASATGATVYQLTGEAILTYQKAGRNQKYIQDGTAAILIDDPNGIITTTYNVGDGITGIAGTLGTYSQLLQFTPVANPAAATSTGNVVVPEVKTLANLTADDQAKLVKILGVSFETPTGNFANSMNYNINDASGVSVFRTAFLDTDGCNYIGTPIPTEARNITALVGQFNAQMQITARSLADFEASTPPVNATQLAITLINPASPFVNTDFAVTVESRNAENQAQNVNVDTAINLSLATGTGTLSGTLTGTILAGTSNVVISGVLYNVAEGNVSITASTTSGMNLSSATSLPFAVQSIPATPTATVVLRPAQIDLDTTTSQSAVLMQVQAYPTDDVRYRLYNGANQYNPWDGTLFVSSSSYSAGPQPLGTPTTNALWWIVFERGNNNATAASYRDRQGPAYSANFQTIALPAATAMTDAFSINMNLPLTPLRYNFANKYVILGYDAIVDGNLISATSSDLTTGAFSLKASAGTVIRRLEVRALDNTFMESLTGEWDGDVEIGYYDDVAGLTGAALRSGLRTITSTGQLNNSYDASRYHMYSTLDNVSNSVTCVYTAEVYPHPAGNNSTPTGLSAEHSYPQDWFSGHTEQSWMESDLHALFPANTNANSARSNYPYDYVSSITSTWGTSSYSSYGGTNTAMDNTFEVADQFKGDAARAILYVGMRYYTDNTNYTRGGVNMLPILLQWHASDPVDTYELNRNNGKFAFQGNRNPFVDHPEWVSSIWGDIAISAPSATGATNTSEQAFTANWTSVAGAASYRLDVATNSTFTTFVSGFKNKAVSGTSQAISSLDPGITYYYRVRALSASGDLSLNSNTITVNTTTDGSVAYYWNFNNNIPATDINWTQPIASNIGSGNITYNLTKAVSFGGTTLGGESGETTGGSFVPQGGLTEVENNGNYMELTIPATGYENLVLSYVARRTTTGFNAHEIQSSLDGSTFETFTTIGDIPSDWNVSGVKTVDFASLVGANNNPNFKVRIVFSGASAPTGNNRIDNVKVLAAPYSGGTTPQISINASMNPFTTLVGSPSTAQTYTLGGVSLSSNINIVAPAQFEISSNGTTYSQSLSLPSSFSGTISVRMTGTTLGSYSGNITHNSTGASEVLVAVSGSVTEPVVSNVAYYWNFNSNVPASNVSWAQPINSSIGNGSISYTHTEAFSFNGTTLNGEAGEVSGGSFAPRGGIANVNNGAWMEFAIPTTSLQNLSFSYAIQRTSTGFTTNEFQCSLDGVNFVSHSTVTDIPSSFGIKTVDLSTISGANNNPNFKLRIIFAGASAPTANNRIDNIKITAEPFSGGGDDPLPTPQNVQISSDGVNISITWDAVTGAQNYRVYSSDDPNNFDGTYQTVTDPTYTLPAMDAKKFFRITAN